MKLRPSFPGKGRRSFKKIIKALPKSVRLGAEGFLWQLRRSTEKFLS